MRRAAVVVGALAAAVTGAVLLAAGTAQAKVYGDINDHDADAYAMTLNIDGWLGSASQARAIALGVCSSRANGVSEKALSKQVEQTYSGDHDLPYDLVGDAEFHFCPAYAMKADDMTPLWVYNPNWPGGWAPNDPTIRGAVPGYNPISQRQP